MYADIGRFDFTLSVDRPDQIKAYEQVQHLFDQVIVLVKKGAPSDLNLKLGQVEISTRYKLNAQGRSTHEIDKYFASRDARITSSNVKWIAELSGRLNALLGHGY